MRLRRGMILAVEFLDHVEDGSKPEPFVVYGELAELNRRYLCIDSWAYPDQRLKHDDNEKRFTIMRSAVTRITRLVPAEEKKTDAKTPNDSRTGN